MPSLFLPACEQGAKIREQALADSEAVMFGSIDGVQLAGRLFGPDTATAGVVLAHMLPADQSSWFDFADQLGELGYRTLTFNFRGYCPGGDAGCSEGEKDISAIWQDVAGAVGFLRTEGVRRIGLVGASMGGTASLVYASQSGSAIDAVVTLSAPDAIEGLTAGPEVLQAVTGAKLFIAGNGDGNAAAHGAGVLRRVRPPKRVEIVASADHGTDLLDGNQAEIVRNLVVRAGSSSTCPSMSRPIVFLTDYGLGDEFVGVCHAVMLRIAPDAPVIDLTHAISRQDVLHGAIDAGSRDLVPARRGRLRRRRRSGRGSASGGDRRRDGRRARSWWARTTGCCRWRGKRSAAPTRPSRSSPTLVLHPVSKTFHGRDVFAPAAAHLAAGMPLADARTRRWTVGRARASLELPAPMVAPGKIGARVIGVDGFGNVQLNVGTEELERAGIGPMLAVRGASGAARGRLRRRAGGNARRPSSTRRDQLALVVNQGSAAATLELAPGKTVVLE